jgi:dTDP-4-amino-4,6-dideoxygalactose transaminase
MGDIAAAMGRIQLKKINIFLSRRKEIADIYQNAINNKGWTTQKTTDSSLVANNYRFVIRLSSKKERDNLKKYLLDNGVRTSVPIEDWELLHNYLKIKKEHFPVAERLADTTLSIPIFPSLKKDEVNKIANLLKEF